MTIQRVTDLIWRGPRPRTKDDLRWLKSNGIERVICLQSGMRDRFADDYYESPDAMQDVQIDRENLYWSNIFPPTDYQINEFLNILMGIDMKTYVHCHSGVDRTGYAIACYRMHIEKWPFEKAYWEWVRLGRHWWFDWWKIYMKKEGTEL